ncbi:MAG: hypothetical protein ABI162_01585 [Luteolibacter sp.]
MLLESPTALSTPAAEPSSHTKRQISPSAYRSAISLLKRLIHGVAKQVVSRDIFWKPLAGSIIRGSQFLCSVRDNCDVEKIVRNTPALNAILAKHHVVTGPFEGLDYDGTRSFCSTFYPKLLGTYEHELESAINSALHEPFGLVVDVGAADGYYAVGFAFKNRQARVIAYEQDPRARIELKNLATINGVSDRVSIRGRCDTDDLLQLPADRGLMIVDCEGFEEFLLTAHAISHLNQWDFIIETHDGYDPEITNRLSDRFAATHRVERIEAIHDLNKADHVQIPLLKGIPRRNIDKLLAENRQHACLRWIVCHSRSGESR